MLAVLLTRPQVMKRLLKILGTAVLAVPLLFWLLTTLLLPGVIRDQAQAFGEKIGYRIEVGAVEVTPFQLRVRVQDLRLSPTDAVDDALFQLQQLEVDARFWPLLRGQLNVAQIVLDQPAVLLHRPAGAGGWNWVRLLDRINTLSAAEPAQDPEEHATFRVSVDAIIMNEGRIAVRDGVQKTALDLGPFSLRLTELSNQDEAGHVGGASVQSKYTLNLGRVKIPLPMVAGATDRQLVFNKVTASGRLVGDAESQLNGELNLLLDDGEITSTWQMAANGALSGNLTVTNLAVNPWLVLAPTVQPLDSPSGVVNANLELKQDATALTLNGDVKVDQLDIRVRGAKDSLVAWNATGLSGLRLQLPHAEGKAGQLTLNEIRMDNPRIRFVINAQGQTNFGALFGPPEAPAKAVAAADSREHAEIAAPVDKSVARPTPEPRKAGRTTAPGFRYDIRSVTLKNGFMHFADESIKPVFRVDVTDLNGSVQGISNDPGRYATLVLNGRAAKTGSLRARGQLAFADPRLNHDVSLIFKNIPLNATNPYAMTFAGYRLEDGRIDVDLRYVTKDGQLQGKNRFVIKKIKLGEEVPDYQGTRLPLGLAIALLEDSDGMIDVNIPVKGNVNDPEFSAGHLVWQAIKTVLANVVTAPFRALGALLGIENLDAIGFIPGESALPIEDEEPLTKIAELLGKRPKSHLVIHGTYDAAVDGPALARAMADKAILQASGIKVVAGEPLPLPNLTDPKVKAGMNSAYGAQVGRIKLGQRLLTLPDNAERSTQLRQELIQSYQITETQLKELATQRANAVKARLLAVDAPLADRITIADPETVSADESKVPLRVTIESGH